MTIVPQRWSIQVRRAAVESRVRDRAPSERVSEMERFKESRKIALKSTFACINIAATLTLLHVSTNHQSVKICTDYVVTILTLASSSMCEFEYPS